MIFDSREHAGQLLAGRLTSYNGKKTLVLAVPRGAAPMARIIADEIQGDLDVVLVRKLGYPGQPELAIGAIDEKGNTFLADYAAEVPAGYLEQEKQREMEIIRERRALYSPGRAPVDAKDRIVIVVDDGIATGSTMMTALRAVRAMMPQRLVCAVAVASHQAVRAISGECDEVVCLHVPAEFFAVGQFFRDFSQVSDEDVIAILQPRAAKISAAG